MDSGDFPVVVDNFTFEDVQEDECVAAVCDNICALFLEEAGINKVVYLTIAIPCYNEELPELLKTINSLMQNVEFIKHKVRVHQDGIGKALVDEFTRVVPIIVPIFDGMRPMSSSMKDWVKANFPGVIDDMEIPNGPEVRAAASLWWYCGDEAQSKNEALAKQGKDVDSLWRKDMRRREVEDTIIRYEEEKRSEAGQSRLGYTRESITAERQFLEHSKSRHTRFVIQNQHSLTSTRNSGLDNSLGMTRDNDLSLTRMTHASNLGRAESVDDFVLQVNQEISSTNLIYFYIVPIFKRKNHRKHNSHQ